MIKFVFKLFVLTCWGSQICVAQISKLYDFNSPTGRKPIADLSISGNVLYGMTPEGGTNNLGVIFSLNTDGTGYKVLLNFDGANGKFPQGSLVISGNVLYGITALGGANNYGTIFSINTDGSAYKDLLDFTYKYPGVTGSSLILDGNVLYGISGSGQPPYNSSNYGTIFSINTDGTGYKSLFNLNYSTGIPATNAKLAISDNVLFGMAYGAGADSYGNIFKINTDGTGYKKLLVFNKSNGAYPSSYLIISGDTLYGMTPYEGGGLYPSGLIFSIHSNGSNFKKLKVFASPSGAGDPFGSLTISGNKLFGMARSNGASSYGGGSIFSINTDGTGFQDLYLFDNINGRNPYGSLILSGNMLYGMTKLGGASFSWPTTEGDGVVFSLNTVTGINEESDNDLRLNIYPNPSNANFVLETNSKKNQLLKIYDTSGNLIHSEILENGKSIIDNKNLAQGIYFLCVSNNVSSLNRKFVVVK